MTDKKARAFGGAKVIYVARFAKESAQKDPETSGDIIERPWSEDRGDLITYFSTLTNFNSYHARCLRVKSDTTVNLGIDVLDEEEDPVGEDSPDAGTPDPTDATREVLTRLSVVNDYGQSFQEVISRVSLDYETTGNGYLEIVPAGSASPADVGPRDIVIVESAPNDIGMVAGLVTAMPQNITSHVNLRLGEKGIPNASWPTVYDNALVASLDGALVRLVVTEANVVMEPALLSAGEEF